MKFNDYMAHLVNLVPAPLSELTELQRALKEGTNAFDEADNAVPYGIPIEYQTGDIPGIELKAKPGPGGGVEMKPFHAGFFLTALMLNGPRRLSARSTWEAWHLTQEGSEMSGYGDDFKPTLKLCPLSNQLLFGNAIKAIIGDGALACRVDKIRIDQERDWAEIVFDNGRVSRFEHRHKETPGNLRRIAELGGTVIHETALMLQAPDPREF